MRGGAIFSDRKQFQIRKYPQKTKVVRFSSNLWQSYYLNETTLTQENGFDEAVIFHMDHANTYPNPILKGSGGAEDLTSTTIFKKCGVKTSWEGQEHCNLKIYL